MWTLQFWKDLAERAVKTFVYALIAALPGAAATQPVTGLPWGTASLIALSATALSVLGSLASNVVVNNGTASMTKAVVPAEPTPVEHTEHTGTEH